MNIGKLNQRLTILEQLELTDARGLTKVDWQAVKTVWAGVNNLYGKEYWEAKSYKAESTLEVVIRFSAFPNLHTHHKIKYRGKLYNVTHVDNLQYANKVLKVKMMEATNGL
jgi:SPP1 family predicted phage head-tail adaptor